MKEISKILLFISIMLLPVCSNLSGQDSTAYPKDYRSIKLLNGTVGIIGLGFGYAAHLEVPVWKLFFSGSVGFKDSSVRDSTLTYNGHQYIRIVTGDGRGMVYSAGIGFRIKRYEAQERLFIVMRQSSHDYGSYTEITQWGHNETFPVLKSSYIMMQVRSLQTGRFISVYKGFNDKVNIMAPGSNFYLQPGIRLMKEININSFDAYVLKTLITDFGLITTPDLKQVGLSWQSEVASGPFNLIAGCSLIRRFDRPSVVDNPFGEDTKYKWVFPFQITIGGTIYNRDMRHMKRKSGKN